MKRYLRLYFYFLQFSFSKAVEFRIDFTFRIVMDVIYYAVNILLFKTLFLHTELIAGWNHEQMMVFVSCYLLIDAINMTVFSTNMWWLPNYINKGELDYYLIRPVNPLFFLSLREFSANSFVNLVTAVAFFIYALSNYTGAYNWMELLGLIVLLINGALIYYNLNMLMIIPVFWTHSSRGFIDLFFSLGLAMERPDKIFQGWLRVIFTVIVPLTVIASFPARAFLEGFTSNLLLHITLVTVGVWSLMLFLWKQGLKNYSSASS